MLMSEAQRKAYLNGLDEQNLPPYMWISSCGKGTVEDITKRIGIDTTQNSFWKKSLQEIEGTIDGICSHN